MKYKAIGFDWGGVLNGRPGKFFGQEVSELLGVTQEEYLKAYLHYNKKFNRGEVTQEELWNLVLMEIGQPDKAEGVMRISRRFEADDLNQDVLDLVDRLRTRGYRVGLLSNNTHEKATLMREKGIDRHFDVFHISAETALVKPEPEAFQHMASELGVKLEEFVFVDDSEKSLSTAEECGFGPLLFESYEQLTNELTNLGVL